MILRNILIITCITFLVCCQKNVSGVLGHLNGSSSQPSLNENNGSTDEDDKKDEIDPKTQFLNTQFRWSQQGPIPLMNYCTQFFEPEDPNTWEDNYLCSKIDLKLTFRSHGILADQYCIKIYEDADNSHGWHDNYLCSPYDLGFEWSQNGPLRDKVCLQIYEDADAIGTWYDNYLCW